MKLAQAPEPADNLEGEREAPGNGAGLDDEDMEEEDFAERMRAKAQAQRSKHGQAIPVRASCIPFPILALWSLPCLVVRWGSQFSQKGKRTRQKTSYCLSKSCSHICMT